MTWLGDLVAPIPAECALTQCHLPDRSGFLCMTDGAIEVAMTALNEVAERAGISARAVVGDINDPRQPHMMPDRRGVRRMVGGMFGLFGWFDKNSPDKPIFWTQRFVNYDKILTDDEAEKIRTALAMKRAEKKLIVIDEATDLDPDLLSRIYGSAHGGGRLIVDIPR